MKQLSDLSPQERMIQQQLRDRGINDPRILEAMRTIPREQFFPTDLRQHAHADRAAPIGHGQTISQPYIVALMTHRLDLRPNHRVLEIGTGSGYQTAILSRLAQLFVITGSLATATVIGVLPFVAADLVKSIVAAAVSAPRRDSAA